MKRAAKVMTRAERRRYVAKIRERLIYAGFDDRIDEIIASASPKFAIDSIKWLNEAVIRVSQLSCEKDFDVLGTLNAILKQACSPQLRRKRRKVSINLVDLNIVPPEANSDSMYFRILEGARAALPSYYK